MAIGFTPKHIEKIPLGDLTKEQFLVLSEEAVKKLKWKSVYRSVNGLVAYTDHGLFAWNAEVKIQIENGVASIQSSSTGNEMMDWGKNKRNANRFVSSLEALKSTLTKEELDSKYEELKEQIVSDEEDLLKLPPATATEEIMNFFSIFKPTEGFFITPILLDLNILIFIAMAISGVSIMSPDSESLLNWGANFRPMTLEGEWWRLITNCFLHIGIFHLLMNMYALLNIGILLEPYLGRTRFISAYLLTGITASMASLWWHDLTISAGASGAIFGMYGIFLAMLTTNLIEKTERKAYLASIGIFVGYNLLYGLKGGIDNAAHIGGLLGGMIIGYSLIPSLKNPEKSQLKFGTMAILSILILVSSFIVYTKIPNDIGAYEAKMKEFTSMESKALEVYNLPPNTPNDKILYEIKDKGIYYWKENIKLLDSVGQMDLPVELQTRNRILKEYCELRIESYELLYKAIAENTNQYEKEIDDYNNQIDAKIAELDGSKQSEE